MILDRQFLRRLASVLLVALIVPIALMFAGCTSKDDNRAKQKLAETTDSSAENQGRADFLFQARRLFLSGDPSKPGWAALYLILCMKMADSGGYFFGMRFGKHKLAPVISPKKSWEGLFGGIIFCVVVNILFQYYVRLAQSISSIQTSPYDGLATSTFHEVVKSLAW